MTFSNTLKQQNWKKKLRKLCTSVFHYATFKRLFLFLNLSTFFLKIFFCNFFFIFFFQILIYSGITPIVLLIFFSLLANFLPLASNHLAFDFDHDDCFNDCCWFFAMYTSRSLECKRKIISLSYDNESWLGSTQSFSHWLEISCSYLHQNVWPKIFF